MNASILTLRIASYFSFILLSFLSQSALAQCEASFSYGGQDTVCINTSVSLTDLSTSPNGIGAWDWTANGNQLTGTTGSASFNPTEEGIYEIILEAFDVQFTCSDRDTVTIVVLGNPSATIDVANISCHGLCDGTATASYDSQNSGAYTATWSGGGTDPLADLCAGVYVAEISDGFGCTSTGFTVQGEVFEPDELLSNISNGAVVLGCSGDADIQLNVGISGGTPNGNGTYNVLWDPALGISDVFSISPLLDPGVGNQFQIYTANITDDRGCTTSSTVQLLPSNSQVHGVITVGGNPCANCEMVFFEPLSAQWNRLFTGVTDASGNYLFGNVPGQTEFRLMADPDDVVHPDVLQGFYTGAEPTHLWSQSVSLNSGCGASLQKDIDLPNAPQHNGQCTLKGALYQLVPGKAQTEEDPIPLIDVVVEKTPPGSAQAKATTDINGEFEFNFMESSDTIYTLYVNIPGLPMNQTHQFTIGPEDVLHDQLDLCVNLEGTFISTCTALGVDEPESEASALSAYPNPSNGSFNLAMGSFEGSATRVIIFDVAGRAVVDLKLKNTPKQKSISGLSQGYYLVRVANKNRSETLPISVLDY